MATTKETGDTFWIDGDEYKPIPGHDGYAASRGGCIASCYARGVLGKTTKWRKRKLTRKTGSQYLDVHLAYPKPHTLSVHRLILTTWKGKGGDGEWCQHRNGFPRDNRLNNLFWGTTKQMATARDNRGHGPLGSLNGNAKLTENDVYCIRNSLESGSSRDDLAALFSVDAGTIGQIERRITWGHLPA